MEIIHEINLHIFSGVRPSPVDLDKLEFKMYRNDPKWLRLQFSGPDEHCRELAWRHARTFYYACHIYLVGSLRKQPPHSVTHFVEQGIKQVAAISSLEAGLTVSGLMWPCFVSYSPLPKLVLRLPSFVTPLVIQIQLLMLRQIIACETEDPDLRLRIKPYFDKRECWGMANVTTAKEVVLAVWNRRDKTIQGSSVLWHEVMAEMGIDIILS
ncbi:fungal-specific transcription factor domain-containing protein [Penicillium hispanicum]|uniref:fungal-specific transcription factor domain-containing protein n=1 Tax=Penicillium hispanicum TaxID=1080232 RepID=UPI0025425CF3|nr:fungal-specific transcription factor domain-containing protein [Penicillium hispanicum]KAJ5587749.1 fungal-specific transcription factor domain-containing protein [Penicillium hispanicum]